MNLAFQGKTVALSNISTATSGADLQRQAQTFFEQEASELKLLYKGKKLAGDSPVFDTVPKKTPKIMVLATSSTQIKDIQCKRSDPTIRGFDQERTRTQQQQQNKPWGPATSQDKNYKFCRFQACTWQSFGHRPTDGETPHAFAAMQLLEKLATDPGIVAVMKERELIVGTLGEMDPVDDRLMQKKQQQGGCLLGYNTNGGMRIDVKLRNDDLKGFRPYPQLVATLIHELSHNWVGEHNLLFWTNHGQMRAEYLHTHARLRSDLMGGKTSAEIAGLDKKRLENVYQFVMHELKQDMAQHGLHPNMIEDPIRQRCRELDESHVGQRLGGTTAGMSARDLALEAAERRAREQSKGDEDNN